MAVRHNNISHMELMTSLQVLGNVALLLRVVNISLFQLKGEKFFHWLMRRL